MSKSAGGCCVDWDGVCFDSFCICGMEMSTWKSLFGICLFLFCFPTIPHYSHTEEQTHSLMLVDVKRLCWSKYKPGFGGEAYI